MSRAPWFSARFWRQPVSVRRWILVVLWTTIGVNAIAGVVQFVQDVSS